MNDLPTINYFALATGPKVAKRPLRNTQQAADYARRIIPDDGREHFVVLLLNGVGHVLGAHVVSIGTVNTTASMPAEVFRAALLTPGCSAIIAVHNHPSGVVGLTQTDKRGAKALREAGKILGIEVLDYLVIVHRAVGTGKPAHAAFGK